MTTQSTEEAMQVLKRWRGYLIAMGRVCAVELCREFGTTNSRQVTDEMERRGLLEGYVGGYYWVGAVFNKSDLFVATGEHVVHSNPARNNHEQLLRVWRLLPGGNPTLDIPPRPAAMDQPARKYDQIAELKATIALRDQTIRELRIRLGELHPKQMGLNL
jgi:hypothetical protein